MIHTDMLNTYVCLSQEKLVDMRSNPHHQQRTVNMFILFNQHLKLAAISSGLGRYFAILKEDMNLEKMHVNHGTGNTI